MNTSPLNQRFGQLRELLQQPRTHQRKVRLLDLLREAYALDPERYLVEWLPYIDPDELIYVSIQRLRDLQELAPALPIHSTIELNLSPWQHPEQTVIEILSDISLSLVHVLNLQGCRLTDKTMLHLFHTRHLDRLEHLNLSDNQISLYAATQHTSHMPSLTRLNLNNNQIGGMRAVDLSTHSIIEQLTHLGLGSNHLSSHYFMRMLSNIPDMSPLEVLDLHGTWLDDQCTQPMAQCKGLQRLTTLHLSHNRFTDQGIINLFAPSTFLDLHTLHLDHNQLTASTAQTLAQTEVARSLKRLSISQCQLQDEGLRHLSRSEHFRPQTLDLSANNISSEGLAALVQSPVISDLRELKLNRNQLHNDGLFAMANTQCLSKLEHLSIDHTYTSTAGIRALLESDNLGALKRISAKNNRELDEHGVTLLKEALERGQLTYFSH